MLSIHFALWFRNRLLFSCFPFCEVVPCDHCPCSSHLLSSFIITIEPYPRHLHHCAPSPSLSLFTFSNVQITNTRLFIHFYLTAFRNTFHHHTSGFSVPGTHKGPVVVLFCRSTGTITAYANHAFFLHMHMCIGYVQYIQLFRYR